MILLFIGIKAYSQTGKDTVVYNLPVVNDKLIYKDSVKVMGKNAALLDSIAKKWFKDYFKYHRLLSQQGADTINVLLGQGLLEYTVKPGMLNIPFYLQMTIQVRSRNNYYTYKIYDIYFRAKSGLLSSIGYERNPEYLINLYKQKHIGFIKSMSIDRNMIRKYLSATNAAVLECISSLNKAMLN